MESSPRICFSSTSEKNVPSIAMGLALFLLAWPYVQSSSLPARLTVDSRNRNSVKDRKVLESEETKRQMLNVLGMDELPKPRQGIIPHEYMIHIYQKMSSTKSDYKGVNTIRGFVDVGHADSSRRLKFHQIYSFNISALPRSEKIISADLRFLRLSTGQEWRYAWVHGIQYRANLYHKKPEEYWWNGQWYKHTKLLLLGSILFDIRDVGQEWRVFNVKEALRFWRNDTNFVHSLELQVESVKTGYLMPAYAFGLTENGRAHHQRALLVSFTDDGRIRIPEDTKPERKRRKSSKKSHNNAKRKTERKERNRIKRDTKRDVKRRRRRKQLCSRKALYVDFALLGWSDWIIAPPGYNAYFCQGMCMYPIPAHLKPTNHAMVQTTIHYVKKRRVPPACCVPHKLTGLSMLFVDKGNSVVYKKYDNMVVEQCGCK